MTNNTVRRIVLGIGAALLIGGWGMTRYAHDRQQTMGSLGVSVWIGSLEDPNYAPMAGQTIYVVGVLGMALGAGVIGFAALAHSPLKVRLRQSCCYSGTTCQPLQQLQPL